MWTVPALRRARTHAPQVRPPVTFSNLYRPPFKHVCGYFYDADGNTVADMHGDGGRVRARGWGRMQYLDGGDVLHDKAEAAIEAATTADPTSVDVVLSALAAIWAVR